MFFKEKNMVGILSSAFIFTIVSLTIIGGEKSQVELELLLKNLILSFGSFLTFSMSLFVIAVVAIAASPLGKLKLGGPESKPQFSSLPWLTMMFSAGMGIGLLFFGVGEPILHYSTPAPGIDPGSTTAYQDTLGITVFHWALHPWSVYAIVALFIGYFIRPDERNYSLKIVLKKAMGARFKTSYGQIIDIFTIVSIIIGVATSLGLGVMQINAGLHHYLNWEISQLTQVSLIAGITLVATASMLSGLGKGVKRLSEINILVVLLLLASLLIGFAQTDFFSSVLSTTQSYLKLLPSRLFPVELLDNNIEWMADWTFFYWAWWISWSPFVGIFLAKVSIGRSIREFVYSAVLLPSLVAIVWFSILGNSALGLIEQMPELKEIVASDVTMGMFYYLDQVSQIPAIFLGIVTLISITLFFITSSDSASMVVHGIAADGNQASGKQKVYWAFLEGALAAVLLYFGGLQSLQSLAVVLSLPVCLYLLMLLVPFIRILIKDYKQNYSLIIDDEPIPQSINSNN
ncbi:MAG: BCCT family transporter [Oligoflexales bacterium]